jgi:uncharacterized membrane protein YdjX (TVP38/TMEM64 family)
VSRDARARLIVAGTWLALIGGAAAWAATSGRGPAEAATDLVDAIQGSAWGPLAFVAVYLVRPLIFFSAAVLTVAGGFLFGPVGGVVLVVIAANGSAMVAYGLARWLGGERFADPEATGRLTRWTRRLRDRSFETVIVMRLVYLPYDLVSYLAGALRIHPVAFLAGTAIGSAPATVAFVLFGASLESFDGGVPQIDAPVLIASGVMLVAGLAISHLLRRRDAGRPDAAA